MIKFGKTPVDKSQLEPMWSKRIYEIAREDTRLAMFMIDHYIMRLNITMHDTLRMAVIKVP